MSHEYTIPPQLVRERPVTNLSTFRRAYSPQLERLCGSLASWPSRPIGMEVRQPSQDAPGIRAELIGAKEIVSQATSISPEQMLSATTHRELRKRVPSLRQCMDTVRVQSLKVHSNTEEGYYFDLVLDDESRVALEDERNHVWQALESIHDIPIGSSDWKRYKPSINLAHIPIGVLEKETETIDRLDKLYSAVVKGLPLELGPAVLPTSKFQD